jgi:hypothetical protein
VARVEAGQARVEATVAVARWAAVVAEMEGAVWAAAETVAEMAEVGWGQVAVVGPVGPPLARREEGEAAASRAGRTATAVTRAERMVAEAAGRAAVWTVATAAAGWAAGWTVVAAQASVGRVADGLVAAAATAADPPALREGSAAPATTVGAASAAAATEAVVQELVPRVVAARATGRAAEGTRAWVVARVRVVEAMAAGVAEAAAAVAHLRAPGVAARGRAPAGGATAEEATVVWAAA